MTTDISSLLTNVEARLLPDELRSDLMADLSAALEARVQFFDGDSPESLFRAALQASFRDISMHPRGKEFQQFLLVGPAPFELDLPLGAKGPWLSDDETAAAVSYIYRGILEHFKGALAELLAVGPVLRLVESLKATAALPMHATVHWGDAVLVHRAGRRYLKGADLHILAARPEDDLVILCGVGEVKAGREGRGKIRKQLANHASRALKGLRLSPSGMPIVPSVAQSLHQVSVVPSRWPLSLGYRFLDEELDGARGFLPDAIVAPEPTEKVVSDGSYHEVTLRWSREALYAAAFEMTLWYFECVGEMIYSSGVPQEWSEMSPSQAGRNAAKMRLYDAFQRARNANEWDRAIALYNSYSFGWALGHGFRTIDRDLIPDMSFQELRALQTSSPESLGWCRSTGEWP
jgi:hypothetical protein